MSQQSMSLLNFQERFCDEQACLDYLFATRWPKGFACPRCGRRRYSFVSARRLYQCSACRYQTSVTAGTVFHKTRTPIRKWFWMIFMMTRQKSGVSILRMQKLLGIGSYRTAWLMGHKIREAMVDRDSNYKLAGLIEMNDAIIGQHKRGNSKTSGNVKAKIVIGVEQSGAKAGFRFVGPMDRPDPDSVITFGKKAVIPKVVGDTEARTTGKGIAEKVIASGCDDRGYTGRALSGLRSIYAVIANISGNIRGIHHGVSAKHLQRYLSEYCYRFNLRRCESQLFDRGLADCLVTRALTYAELTI